MKLVQEFKKLKNDKNRWKWIIKNKDKIELFLDNDMLCAMVIGSEDVLYFDGFIGWEECVLDLLSVLGIKAETV